MSYAANKTKSDNPDHLGKYWWCANRKVRRAFRLGRAKLAAYYQERSLYREVRAAASMEE
jgi:hypothetical protein